MWRREENNSKTNSQRSLTVEVNKKPESTVVRSMKKFSSIHLVTLLDPPLEEDLCMEEMKHLWRREKNSKIPHN